VLLTMSVLAGLVVKSRPFGRGVKTASATDVYRILALLFVSFSLRRRIGFRNWRRLHWLTYVVFLASTAHGLAAGTASSQPWTFGLYVGAVGAVVFLTAWRALAGPLRPTAKPARERSS
jgi:sulfoxide reductase heme-binding subunit YedZ